MTTVETPCKADGCSGVVRYGIETINTPKYCSFECRDRAEGMHHHGRTGGRR